MKTYSLSEWIQKIKSETNYKSKEELQKIVDEDLSKWDRLKKLNKIASTPIEKHFDFSAKDFLKNSKKLKHFFENNKTAGKYSIKAEPRKEFEKKLFRNRKHSVTKKECFEFVKSLKPSPGHYNISIWENFDTKYSFIFVVNEKGIFIEMKEGQHFHLTQGFKDPKNKIIFGFFDSRIMKLISTEKKYDDLILEAIKHVKTNSNLIEVVNGYVKGYFECLYFDKIGFKFIDYNTTKFMTNLPTQITEMFFGFNKKSDDNLIRGRPATLGIAMGKVKIVLSEKDFDSFKEGNILVAKTLTPNFLPVIAKSLAIVTDFGGVTSHAAVVSRELGKICIVGTENATKLLKDGDIVEVNANKGYVKKLN